jgi:hypothetical protein
MSKQEVQAIVICFVLFLSNFIHLLLAMISVSILPRVHESPAV